VQKRVGQRHAEGSQFLVIPPHRPGLHISRSYCDIGGKSKRRAVSALCVAFSMLVTRNIGAADRGSVIGCGYRGGYALVLRELRRINANLERFIKLIVDARQCEDAHQCGDPAARRY
jgi:hypothetical protein